MTALLFPSLIRPQDAEDRAFLYPGEALEWRDTEAGMELRGVAVKYGVPSPRGRLDFTERFTAGAFHNLSDPNIFACANHRPSDILGRQGAGTLVLADSPEELRYQIKLPATATGRDTGELARRGDLSGVSISFVADTRRQEWSGPPEDRQRTIHRARLIHISPVLAPAHDTSLAVG